MSGRISAATARQRLAAGAPAPLYLLTGDDDAERSAVIGALVECVEEGLRPFNVERFYGSDASLGRVLEAARTLPFGGGARLVMLLHAETLLEPKRDSEMARRDLDALMAYLDEPVPQTVLVLAAGSLDGRTRLARSLRRVAVEVECSGREGLGDPERWIRQSFSDANVKIERSAVRLIVERAGHDAGRLRAEVERVQLYCAGQPEVSREDVLAVVGSPAASDAWAVTRAIEHGDAAAALCALALGLEAGAVPFMILGQLAWFVRAKFPSAKVPDVIDAVFETDLALKRSGGDPRVLLERLVVELCESVAGRGSARQAASSRR